MTIESLRQEHNSRPRNKLIAQVFYLAGFIETWGRGIQKVDEAFNKFGLAVPDYSENGGGILTIISRRTSISSLLDTKDDTKELTDRQREILSFVKEDCTITSQKISQKLSEKNRATVRTIITDMLQLQQMGYLHREGGRKEGKWVILLK